MKRGLKGTLQDKVVLIRARLRQRLGKDTHEILVNGRGFTGLQRILIIAPEGESSFDLVDGLGNLLRGHCSGAALDLLCTGRMRQRYRKTAWAGKVHPLEESSFTALGTPVPALLETLKSEHYELLIDLNDPMYIPAAGLVGCFGQAYRAGVKSEFSGLFYNIEMVPQDRLTAESVFRVLQIL